MWSPTHVQVTGIYNVKLILFKTMSNFDNFISIIIRFIFITNTFINNVLL